ncbi:GyrI-like domain-containing protein [Paenibacillus chartarius]|uniref:GyrI-like domain-containing protein n=1 Tax=Paenibacillus chartarius TaxID=747481 RepID=A0ABV6DLF4_9BACL
MEWLTRMKDALDLIECRMEEPLDINEIAKVAYSSPFHFQRKFHILTGFTVAEYVRRRKLTLAAQELAVSSAKVIDIALKYGYESPEAFAKAFRKAHGITPSAAREPGVKLKAFPRITFHLSLKGDKEMDYRIIDKAAFPVIGKAVRLTCKDGENLREIPKLWGEFKADGSEDKLIITTGAKEILGICMDHTGEDFTYMIAVEGDAASAEFEVRSIPAATWAIFTSVGPMPGAIQQVWQRIYQEWFPATGYEHAGTAEMEVYPPGDPNADDYRCEVWIPIVKK